MKKFIASVAVLAIAAVCAPSAYAAGDNATAGGSTTAASFDSIHTGSVAGTCSLTVTDGALPTGQGFVPSLTSTTKGKISTVCNTTTSKLETSATGVTTALGGQAATYKYNLNNGSGAYSAVNTGLVAVNAVPAVVVSNLSNGMSSSVSNLDVTAEVAAPATQNLAAGNYTVTVTATVTP